MAVLSPSTLPWHGIRSQDATALRPIRPSVNQVVEDIGERPVVHKTLAPFVKLGTIGCADPGFNLGRQGMEAATKLTKKHLGLAFGFALNRSLTEGFGCPLGFQLFKS